MKSIVSFICCIVINASIIYAQGFSAQVFGGLSTAQLQGDNLAGFDKFGLHGGIQVLYQLREKLDVGVEMTYNEKGSRERLFRAPLDKNVTTLKYFELPIIANIKDWYIEEGDYYRMQGHIGVSYGYLFDAQSDNELFSNSLENFSQSDVGFLCGATFMVNTKLGVTARYQRSFTQFFKSEELITGGLLSYSWVIRLGYFL